MPYGDPWRSRGQMLNDNMNVDPSATERSENYKRLRIWSLSFGITTVVVTIAEALVSPTHPSPEPLGWVLIPTAALIAGVGFAFIFSTPLYLVMASGSDAANKRRWLLIRTTICLLFMSCFVRVLYSQFIRTKKDGEVWRAANPRIAQTPVSRFFSNSMDSFSPSYP